MGAGAGKQPKVKKVYVKGKETIDISNDEENASDVMKMCTSLDVPSGPQPVPVSDTADLPQLSGETAAKPSVRPSQVEVEVNNVKPLALQNAGKVDKDHKDVQAESPRVAAKKYSLSPRSISSDEGPGITFQPEVLINPKMAFAQVLREGYERRAQERAAWLRDFDDAPVNSISTPVVVPKPGFSLNDTRLQQPALRDPDTSIVDEVRKWNVKMHRAEAPMAQPIYC
jgi:hypothetical protein